MEAGQFTVGKKFKLNKILILVGNAVINPNTLENLSVNYSVIKTESKDLKTILNMYQDIFALWIHFDTFLSRDYLRYLKKTKYLITTTTALTHIDSEIIDYFGKNLVYLKSESEILKNVSSTAELAWIFIMLSNNNINKAFETVKSGKWDRQNNLRQRQLSSVKLGIVGFGRLGKIVANFANAFNMKVYIYDNNPSKILEAEQTDFICVNSVDDLIRECDIVTLHAKVSKNREKIISKRNLMILTKPLTLINTARGSLVDEAAVIEEIESRPYLNYYTDVLEFEENGANLEDSKLWKMSLLTDRVQITPHIGGANLEAIKICENLLFQALIN